MESNYMNINGEEKLRLHNIESREVERALLYLAALTRPAISAAVIILSRRNEKPRARRLKRSKASYKIFKNYKNDEGCNK